MSSDPRWLSKEEIIVAALPLSGEARQQYLQEHCSDSEMRNEVERLLAQTDETRTAAVPIPLESKTRRFIELSQGSVLGHYRIGPRLGAGGMGRVYEALDEKLNRTVAIKVLPPGEVNDDTRRRFTREAQAASALNHPNIITVYEIGQEGSTDFIAMERISGRTLRQVIGEKGLDARSAIQYASQIADALAAAHEAGIVHRDLKPGNVMVTERGLVKVLDFGIAKHVVKAHSQMPAIAPEASLTASGQIVGTVSYMSPEQAEGKPVDWRSDIFSFGSVFYEMLTGRRAFEESSSMGTLAAVLNKEPAPLRERSPGIPPGIDRLIGKCLQKKPHDRWQHMSDVKLVLQDVLNDLDSPPSATQATPERNRFRWIEVSAAGLAGALLVAWAFYAFRPGTETGPEPIPRLVTADSGLNTFPTLSKDGKLLAYASDRAGQGNLDIWLLQIGGREPIRRTMDPADETDPAFSPDGTRIVFRSERNGGGIYVAPALEGEAVLLAPGGRNPRFSPDGRLIAYWTGLEGSSAAGGSNLFVIEAGGGEPRQIGRAMAWAEFPVWSPDGGQIIALGRKEMSSATSYDWWIVPIDQGEPKQTGALAQLRTQKLMALQFGLGVPPVPLDWVNGEILFAAPLGDSANLWRMSLKSGVASGLARRVTHGPGRHMRAAEATTADGSRIVFSDENLNFDVWTLPVDAERGVPRGELRRFTHASWPEWSSSVSHDGKRVVYVTRHFGNWAIESRDQNTGREHTLLSSALQVPNAKLSGDGSRVVFSNAQYHLFMMSSAGGPVDKLCDRCGTVMGVSVDGNQIMVEPMENEDLLMFDVAARQMVKLASRPGPEFMLSGGRISPDGKWVAFHSVNSSMRMSQVWIASINNPPVATRAWIPVTQGKEQGRDPCWSPNGSILYFISEVDGSRCIWARRLDVKSKTPLGPMFPVEHFHSARYSLRRVDSRGYLTGLSAGGDRLVFALAELTGNIWLEERVRER